MKTFKQRLMLVATLMVIAVSGYAAEQFVTVLEGDVTNLNVGEAVTGIWSVWGSPGNDVSGSVKDVNGEKYLELTNPSGTDFWHAQLGYGFEKALDQSKRYKFSFKAKCASGSSQLQWQYQNKDYKNQGGYGTFDINDSEWKLCEVEFSPNFEDDIRIIINFGKDQKTFYIDDIVFGYYEEVQEPDPTPDPEPITPTGSLNNTMYFDGTQWCLMLEDFEGKTIGDNLNVVLKDGSDGTATVVADPLGKSNNSLNFISGNYTNENDYYYIDVTLPESKTLSDTYFEKLIFDVVCNTGTGVDNNNKSILVKIGNTSTELGNFWIGTPNTASWETKTFDLTGKYTSEKTFRIYIGGVHANRANLFIDNIRLSVKTTASGTCGSPTPEDVNWMFDENSKTLYISGTGDIADNKPWDDYKANISNIIIGEGITAIGNSNFWEHRAITSISLPSTLKKIGAKAFSLGSGETNLAIDLIIPEGVTSIGSEAFSNRNGLKSVELPSTLQEIGSKGFYIKNGSNKKPFTFHSNPTMGANALYNNYYTATLVLNDSLNTFFAATSTNTFNGGIHYKRTLSAQYSTISLPFKPTSGLENCTFYELNAESLNALIFEKVPNTNLVAGKPYIVKTEGQTPAEIDFRTDESITIPANAAAGSTVLGTWTPKWTMHGTYSTLVINSGENANAYGFSGNALKRNTGNMTVKPFRAYFTKSSDSPAKDYLDVIFGGEVTGIERNEFSPEDITEIFSLDGKKHDCLQKGMNIVKMNNGSIKKIVIK